MYLNKKKLNEILLKAEEIHQHKEHINMLMVQLRNPSTRAI